MVSAVVVAAAVAVPAVLRTVGSGAGQATPVALPAAAAPKISTTPFGYAMQTLDRQEQALLRGDEKGWLAAVDARKPKLVARYRGMFRSLRGLGVSHFNYEPSLSPDSKGTTAKLNVGIAYCLSRPTCPPGRGAAPRVSQALTLAPSAGRYVITRLGRAPHPDELQPTPWEQGELVFAHGPRVTVAGPPSQRKNLRRVLAAAEKSAKINDRFAGYVRNPQVRYRILLADEKAWKSWYGGIDGGWTVGYAVPLNNAGTDVVLRMRKLTGSRELLTTTIQHELGHVVTLSGADGRDFDRNQWLSEGIAEYIGWAPRHAADSWRRSSVRAAFHDGKKPKSVVLKGLSATASDTVSDRFYGLGHFTADCLATRYGEPALFDFVRLTLREAKTYDQASRAAFGKPFPAVDKDCLSWIRKTAS